MQYKEGTLGAFLKNGFDSETIEHIIRSLDLQMYQIHKRGYCLKNISFSSVCFDEYQNVVFSDFYRAADSFDIYTDMRDFTNFSLGLYVLTASKEAGFYSDVSLFDYSVLSRQNKNFVLEKYEFIRRNIPQELVDYYDGFVLNNQNIYLCDFIKNKEANQSNKSNSISLVKATQIGKALTDKENNNAAFAQIVIYPILLGCALMLASIVYIFILIYG